MRMHDYVHLIKKNYFLNVFRKYKERGNLWANKKMEGTFYQLEVYKKVWQHEALPN